MILLYHDGEGYPCEPTDLCAEYVCIECRNCHVRMSREFVFIEEAFGELIKRWNGRIQ